MSKLPEGSCKPLKETFNEVIFDDGAFYHWIGDHWKTLSEGQLRLSVHQFDGAAYPVGDGKVGYVRLNKSRVDSVLSEMRPMAEVADFFAKPPTGINCRSGFIRFDGNSRPTLEPHNPEHRQRHVLSGGWAPDGSLLQKVPGSLLDRLLKGCFDGDPDIDDKIRLLQQVAGITALGQGTKIRKPKALILKGETAENGKSQILDLLRSLVPPGASTAISPRHFDDGRYIVKLAGKLLNAPDELGGGAVTSEEFKKAVTGNEIVARDVYKSSVEFKPVAQHVCATNVLPPFKGGMDRGVRRRLMVLTFNRVIPMSERVENIGMRVGEEEADLLLAWAIEGAKDVLRQGAFTEPASSKESLNDWIVGADPVIAWLEEADEIDYGNANPEGLKVRTKEVYAEFRCWALEEGIERSRIPAAGSFTQRVVAAGKRNVRYSREAEGRFFIGLAPKKSRRLQDDAVMTRR